jgi:hypothetical protein
VGDAEREQALQALGDHMSAGRLDIEEYGERTAQVATSKTRGELLELFRDLPDPKPRFGPPAKTPPIPVAPRTPAPAHGAANPGVDRWQARPVGQRMFAALIPLSFLAALVFFFVTKAWPVFFLPVAMMIIGGSMFGEDWSHDRRAWEREQRRRRRHGRY